MQQNLESENIITPENIIKDLSKYMLYEDCIHKALELKFSKNVLKKDDNQIKKFVKLENPIFIPKEKDSLFWCFFIMKYGSLSYDMIEYKNIVVEKKYKIEYIDKIRKEKKLIKTYKFTTLTNLENKLANDDRIDINTFLTLCVLENINVLFVHKRTYYELLMNDSEDLFIVHFLNNGKYGFETNLNNISEKYKSSLLKIDNLEKPIKSMSFYKLSELQDFCEKLGIDISNNNDKKRLGKKELYELIIQYF